MIQIQLRQKYFLSLAIAISLYAPAYSDELKFPMYGDFDKKKDHSYPVRIPLRTPAMKLVNNSSKGETIVLNSKWTSWAKDVGKLFALNISHISRKNGIKSFKIKRACEFSFNLTDKGQLSRPKILSSSGSKTYDLFIWSGIPFSKKNIAVLKSYPGNQKYKQLSIHGSISPTTEFEIHSLTGYTTYEIQWNPLVDYSQKQDK